MNEDQLEDLLRERFSAAIEAEALEAERFDVAGRVLGAIRRRERQRFVLLLVLGCAAAAVCLFSGLPLLLAGTETLLGMLAEPDWAARIAEAPATGLLIGLGVLIGWLVLLAEDPT